MISHSQVNKSVKYVILFQMKAWIDVFLNIVIKIDNGILQV